MFYRTVISYLVASVGAKTQILTPEGRQTFVSLQSLLESNVQGMNASIQNLKMVENSLHIGSQKLMLLEEANAYEDVDKALEIVSGAVSYVNHVSEEAGDVERVKEVLSFMKKEAVILVKYSGDMLMTSLQSLTNSAVKLKSSMNKVNKLAGTVKSEALEITNLLSSFEGRGTPEEKATWKVILGKWQGALSSAKDSTEEVRVEFQVAVKAIMDMQSEIEYMSATVQIRAGDDLKRKKIALEDANAAIRDQGGCSVWEAIFTVGQHCRNLDAAKKTNQRTANKLAEQEQALKDTVAPMLAKIDTIKDIGDRLLNVGYKNMEAINDFLNRLILAADYFDNAGRLFFRAARTKHIGGLAKLVASCDAMLAQSTAKSNVYETVIKGNQLFQTEVANIDGDQFEKEIKAQVDAETVEAEAHWMAKSAALAKLAAEEVEKAAILAAEESRKAAELAARETARIAAIAAEATRKAAEDAARATAKAAEDAARAAENAAKTAANSVVSVAKKFKFWILI